MGQRCFGIMYGVQYDSTDDEDEFLLDRASDAAWNFDRGDCEWDGDHVGLWVAVGGSGKADAGDLDSVNGLELTPEGVRQAFPEDVAACEAAWPAFVAHMKEQGGIELTGEPKLFLVATETA